MKNYATDPVKINWQTELKKPEVAQYWLAAIIESADDAVISKTLDGVITSWNAGAERIFGYSAEEAIGQLVTMLIPDDHPDEESMILERIRAGERVEHYETVRVRKDGRLVDISLTVSPIKGANDRIIGASKIARDITGQKRDQQRLSEQAEIIETVNRLGPKLAAELDLHRLVQTVIDAATGIIDARFGSFFYRLLDEEGQSYIHCAVAGIPREMFSQTQNSDILSPEFEATVLLDDVTKDPAHAKRSPYYGINDLAVKSYLAVPITSRSGAVHGGLFLGHSQAAFFTERSARIIEGIAAQTAIAMDNARLYETAQRTRAEAEHAARMAEESSRLKEEFLATVSHELRTPLNAILGWTRMLRAGSVDSATAARALVTIERNARMQAQLIDDLLDVSRIVTGKMRMDVRPIDPTAFTEAAIEAVRPAADAKGVRLVKLIDTGAIWVPGDPVRLQQVVWNLLSNAVKFTPRGGKVQVHLERVNSHVEIVVMDTGQGIAAEFMPHVFDRFRQADQASTRQHGGMGLGLSIVRHLVEMHGGAVTADSPGKDLGATFTVRLPLSPVYQVDHADGRIHPAAQDLVSPAEPTDRLDGVKVLVIDDEEDTRDLLEAGLTKCGASVNAAGSAAEGFESLTRETPDVIISDIGMPKEDGYQFIHRVRELPNEGGGRVPAVALTAYARFEDRLKALRAGYQMHVPKPVELTELVAVISSLVQRSR